MMRMLLLGSLLAVSLPALADETYTVTLTPDQIQGVEFARQRWNASQSVCAQGASEDCVPGTQYPDTKSFVNFDYGRTATSYNDQMIKESVNSAVAKCAATPPDCTDAQALIDAKMQKGAVTASPNK